jgi:hypothetical protein
MPDHPYQRAACPPGGIFHSFVLLFVAAAPLQLLTKLKDVLVSPADEFLFAILKLAPSCDTDLCKRTKSYQPYSGGNVHKLVV